MDIQKYLAFLETVEYGSFTKAAEMLGYSQSGISRMIHDLETEWKLALLERGEGRCAADLRWGEAAALCTKRMPGI